MYFIGVDFGHGETVVSRVPGYNGAPVSQVALRISNNNEGKKVVSAICRKEGKWSLVLGEQDYRMDDLREGFKGRIRTRSDREKESMREFAKLIFQTVLDHDTDLVYRSADDRNFELGIACPSDWIREDPDSQQEYLNFFRDECGLPVDYCIKESDAAFFTKYDRYSPEDNVFVIDLGSGTIDFTTYSGSKCIAKCCWGANLGAHIIEDALMSHIYAAGRNRENVARLIQFKREHGFHDKVEAAISLFVRSVKEAFFTENRSTYRLRVEFQELTEKWTGSSWDTCIAYEVDREEFNRIIANYMQSIRETLENARIRLTANGITPNRVLLSGGASRMPFIREYAEQIFGTHVDVDPQPECVVSNGIALYIQKYHQAYDALLKSLSEIDFESIYKKADTEATADAIQELVPEAVSRVKECDGATGDRIRTIFCDFINDLNENNMTFRNLVLSRLRSTLNAHAERAIAGAYKQVFGLDVDVSDVAIDIEAHVLAFSPANFQVGGAWYGHFTNWIDQASGRFSFTWDKPRSYDERCKIAEGVKASLVAHLSSMSITYGNLDSIVEHVVRQVVYYTVDIFRKKQLFEMTFNQ